MTRQTKFRACVLLLLCALFALVALTPSEGNGPSFCLCKWYDLFDGHRDGGNAHECAHCDEDVPLRPGAEQQILLAALDVLNAVLPQRLEWCGERDSSARRSARIAWTSRGGTITRPAQTLNLLI